MEQKKANKLINKIGMEPELSRYLDSQEAYQRFEQAVQGVLNRYRGRTFSGKKLSCDISIDYFMRNYGVGCNPESQPRIARLEHGENFYTQEEELRIRERDGDYSFEKYRKVKNPATIKWKILNKSCRISDHVNKVYSIIKKHKQDIWYGTILG